MSARRINSVNGSIQQNMKGENGKTIAQFSKQTIEHRDSANQMIQMLSWHSTLSSGKRLNVVGYHSVPSNL